MKLDTVFKILLIIVVTFSIQQLWTLGEIVDLVKNKSHAILIKQWMDKIQNFDIELIKKDVFEFFYLSEVAPRPSYFIFFGLSAMITVLVKIVLNKISHPIAEKLIPHKKWSQRIRKIKIQRFNLMFFNLIYFSLISPLGFIVLRNQSYAPKELGGMGNLDDYFEDFPNQKSPILVHLYYFMNGGYLLTSVCSLIFSEKLPDFYENFLQHLCAVILVYFSYSQNFLRVGAIIMLCHDICEIFSSACRVFVDTKYKFITVSSFCFLFSSWGYLRLYIFVKRCILVVHRNMELIGSILSFGSFIWLVFLLMVILLMNTYWFVLMAKMFIHFISSGQTEDILSRVSEIEDEKIKKS